MNIVDKLVREKNLLLNEIDEEVMKRRELISQIRKTVKNTELQILEEVIESLWGNNKSGREV